MGGKRKARGARHGGSIEATSHAAIAAQAGRGPCQHEISANCLPIGNIGAKPFKMGAGMSISCDPMNSPGQGYILEIGQSVKWITLLVMKSFLGSI